MQFILKLLAADRKFYIMYHPEKSGKVDRMNTAVKNELSEAKQLKLNTLHLLQVH